MMDLSKIKPSHLARAAFVYVRQSTPSQVEHNRESTARQYALAERACQLGWSKEQVIVLDEDLGLSGSSTDKRSGFTRLTSEVALTHVGIVLGLEVSRLARNNADWYRLLELCGFTDTLIGDSEGVYHPALFNDRLLLGLNRPETQSTSCLTFPVFNAIRKPASGGARAPFTRCDSIATADIADGLVSEATPKGGAEAGSINLFGDLRIAIFPGQVMNPGNGFGGRFKRPLASHRSLHG
jgi:resolvase-like protein